MLIGSRALAHWIPSFVVKPDADWDFIGEISCEVPSGARVEVKPLDHLNDGLAVELFNVNGVCSLKGLTLIKRSHLWRDYFFDKHITQYHKYMVQRVHAIYSPEELDFYKERVRLTKKTYPQGNPKLNQTNEDFFDDAVKKVYDHDYIHELFAYYDHPLYERLKYEDGMDKAWCVKDLWLNLDHSDKIKCIAEETQVIATERFMVPNQWQYPAKLAYIKALSKVCTTLTSGWFRDYAIDYYPEVFNLFDQTRFDRVRTILEQQI